MFYLLSANIARQSHQGIATLTGKSRESVEVARVVGESASRICTWPCQPAGAAGQPSPAGEPLCVTENGK